MNKQESQNTENVCECMCVSQETIQELINSGVNSLVVISNKTGACTGCSLCRSRILEMLGQNNWIKAEMVKTNEKVLSYSIKSEPSFRAGDEVVIQSRINEKWFEKTYTLTPLSEKDQLGVNIIDDEACPLTTWLYRTKPSHVSIYISSVF